MRYEIWHIAYRHLNLPRNFRLAAQRGYSRLRAYWRALLYIVRDIDDERGARFETGEDVQFIAIITPDDDFLKTRPLILGYCHHLRPIGANNQSRGRDSYRRLCLVDAEFCGRVHTRQKLVIRVRDAHDQPGELILWELPDINLHLPPWINRARECLRDIDIDTQRVNPRNLKESSARGRIARASLRGSAARDRRSRRRRASRSTDVRGAAGINQRSDLDIARGNDSREWGVYSLESLQRHQLPNIRLVRRDGRFSDVDGGLHRVNVRFCRVVGLPCLVAILI